MPTTLDNALAYYDSPPYADEGYTRTVSGPGKIGGILDPIGGALGVTDALFGSNKPKTPAWKRIANREWAQGNAALSAYERLFPRTLAMVAKSKNDFGDLELDLFNKYGQKYINAIDSADPAQGALRRNLTDQVSADLSNPGLPASIAREIAQGSRAAWSSRGLAESPASAMDELFSLGERGNALQQQKYQNAASVLSANKSLVGDPFLAITGRSASTSQPDYAGFNNDLFSYGVNREVQNRNLAAARGSAKMAMAGQIIGGLLSGASKFAAA